MPSFYFHYSSVHIVSWLWTVRQTVFRGLGVIKQSYPKHFQDSKGNIWIPTEDGLNRFDGPKFTIYKHHPLPQDQAKCQHQSCSRHPFNSKSEGRRQPAGA